MSKEPKPEHVDLTTSELDALFNRLDTGDLSPSDKSLIKNVFHFSIWLQQKLESGKVTVRNLKRLIFGNSSERRKRKTRRNKDDNDNNEDDNLKGKGADANTDSSNSNDANNQLTVQSKTAKKPPINGHGRMAASQYKNAIDVDIKHDKFKPGDLCPEACGGRLYTIKPGIQVRIRGSNFAKVMRYHLEKLRCNLCGTLVTAVPTAANDKGRNKYDAYFKSILAVLRYFGGMPFYRQEKFQLLLSFPLPDSTQWDLVESVADSAYPVFFALEKLAANGKLIHQDDTTVRILEIMSENKLKNNNERRGMFTTSLVAKLDSHQIGLFYSSTRHAGKNLEKLLSLRSPRLKKIIQMCDGLSSNLIKMIETELCNCLAHGRRRFIQIEDIFPEQCGYFIEQLGEVYHNESLIKAQGLNDSDRLLVHQKNSGPVMDKLKIWLDEQVDSKLIEPNGRLGDAINYVIKRWPELTKFLRIVGAPLDNNTAERALKLAIRSRKASLFYRTRHSAFVASLLKSLIYTCQLNKVNPVDYLKILQEHRSAVFRKASDWLPWTYETTLANQVLANTA